MDSVGWLVSNDMLVVVGMSKYLRFLAPSSALILSSDSHPYPRSPVTDRHLETGAKWRTR